MQAFIFGYNPDRTKQKHKADTLVTMELGLLYMSKICIDYAKISRFKQSLKYKQVILFFALHLLYVFAY